MLSLSWGTGEAPWHEASPLPGSRVLYISNEQTGDRLDRICQRLAGQDERDGETYDTRFFGWQTRLAIVAKDHRDARVLRTLDEPGMNALRGVLARERDSGDGFGFLILDSLSRLKPLGLEEADNDNMPVWLDQLADLAVEFGIYILLLHHTPHEMRHEARAAARGASAIGAVTQVQMLLEVKDDRHRSLSVDGNEVFQRTHIFQVAQPDETPGSIQRFEKVGEQVGAEPRPDLRGYVERGERVSQSDLARRMTGQDGKPSGAANDRARRAIEHAVSEGWGTIEAASGRSTLFRRFPDPGVERALEVEPNP